MEREHKKDPLVTVAAFCYNTGERFCKTLDSIVAQTYSPIELLILDDGSADNSVEIIKEWIKKTGFPCRLIANPVNMGICRVLNLAISEAKGEYFAAIGDDLMLPDKIKDDVELLEKSPGSAFCYSKMITVDQKSGEEEKLHTSGSENTFHDFFAWKMLLQTPTITYRRSIFDEIGKYDEDLLYEDFDMILRITHKYPTVFRDEFTVKYTVNAGSIRIEKQRQMIDTSFGIMKKWSFHPRYRYYVARRHLMYFYFFSKDNKKEAVKYMTKSLRFFFDRRLYLSFIRLIFSRK